MKILIFLIATFMTISCQQGGSSKSNKEEPPSTDTEVATEPTPGCNSNDAITFTDPALETCLRSRVSPLTAADGLPADQPIAFSHVCLVTNIDCAEQQITNLTGLEHFSNLETLDISDNAITDITPIQQITTLQRLDAANNQLTNVISLEHLTELISLKLNKNPISQIEGLASLSKLLLLNLADMDNLDCSSLGITSAQIASSGCGIADGQSTANSLGAINFNTEVSSNSGTRFYLSNFHSFVIPENTISFSVSIFRDRLESDTTEECLVADQNLSDCIRIESFISPSGEDYIADTSSAPIDTRLEHVHTSVVTPTRPEMSAESGEWQIRAFSGSVGTGEIFLSVRTGDLPSSSTLTVQPFLTGSDFSQSDVEPALIQMKQIYENVGLQVHIRDTIVISGTEYNTVTADFDNSDTKDLILRGDESDINLFLVPDLINSVDGTLLGLSGGLPGPQGVPSSRSGVLVGLIGHQIRGFLASDLLGETMAHEIGHWLGLAHTTESNGLSFDVLDDTPECHTSQDTPPLDGRLTPLECLNFGANNLMFWTGDLSIDQTTLTDDQIHVLQRAPIAR